MFSWTESQRNDIDTVTDFELGIDRVRVNPAQAERISYSYLPWDGGTTTDTLYVADLERRVDPDNPYLNNSVITIMKLEIDEILVSELETLIERAGSLETLITEGLPPEREPEIIPAPEPEPEPVPEPEPEPKPEPEQPTENTPVRTITGTDGDDDLVGTAGDNIIYGLGGNDKIRALEGQDKLYGGAGNDRLIGHEQNDKLFGGKGNDWLDGGKGDDILTGGKGADTFFISLKQVIDRQNGEIHSNHDKVTDFELGIDKVALSARHVSDEFQDLVIETFSANDKVKGVTVELVSKIPSVKYPWHETNSLRVKFDKAVETADFNSMVEDAGGLETLLIEVI